MSFYCIFSSFFYIIWLVLFICLGFFATLVNFSLKWRRHHCRWRAVNVDLCSTLMAFEQLGLNIVPHLLWHGASVYNGHFQGPGTLTTFAKRERVELSLPVLSTWVCRGWDSPILSIFEANVLAHRRGLYHLKISTSNSTSLITCKINGL